MSDRKDGLPTTKMADCRKNPFVWQNQFSLGHFKCEMSINIQDETLTRKMETSQVYSSGERLGWGQITEGHPM